MSFITHARALRRYETWFTCPHCHHASAAEVIATGRAKVSGTCDAKALDAAREDAAIIALQTLWFVPCPSCRRLDPRGPRLRWRRRGVALAMATIAAVVARLTILVMERHPIQSMWPAVLVAATLGGVGGYLDLRRPGANARRRAVVDPVAAGGADARARRRGTG